MAINSSNTKRRGDQNSTRQRRTDYTPLGHLFYKSEDWKRKKILKALEAAGISYYSLRGYLIKTPAFQAPGDLRDIVLETLPEAADCFKRPKPEPVQ